MSNVPTRKEPILVGVKKRAQDATEPVRQYLSPNLAFTLRSEIG